MAHNTRPLKRAQDGVAPQYYNPTTDEYEALHGTAGANHVVIYGPDGQPAALATEAKLEAARALLESLDGKDFASETTLAAMETELGLAKTELAAIKGMLTDGTAKGEVTLYGTKVVESAPVTGIKTVTSTVAEVFAGSSRKANRSKLIIRNLHPAVAIRIGGSGITDTIGQSVEPGASVEIDFSPSTAVPIYAVSTAGNVSVEVLEV